MPKNFKREAPKCQRKCCRGGKKNKYLKKKIIKQNLKYVNFLHKKTYNNILDMFSQLSINRHDYLDDKFS